MRIHIGNGNGGAGAEPEQLCIALCQPPGALPKGDHGPRQLFLHNIPKGRIERCEKFRGGIALFFVINRFIACAAGVARECAAQLPGDEIRGFNKMRGGMINLRRMVQSFPNFRDHPFA